MSAVLKLEAQDMGIRVPPHSLEAEQAVLGGLMIAPDKIEALTTKLSEGDFYRRDHRVIWRAMLELSARGEPCDAVTLGDWFERNGLAQMMGGMGYCAELANGTASAANIVAYAQIVREKSIRRQLIDQAMSLAEDAYQSDRDGQALVDDGIQSLMAMQKVEARSEYTLRQAMTAAYETACRNRELGGAIPGIPFGLDRLDAVLGGAHDSDLVIVGARPAMGKTALLLNFMLAHSLPCGLISAEQPYDQMGGRVLSIRGRVDAEKMRSGRFDTTDLRKLEGAVGDLLDRTCLIYDRSSPTIADVARMARKWKQQNGIRALYVDYVQRIEHSTTSNKANKTERVGEVVRGLKNLARDLEIPVIALAQVNRQADGRQPGMGDLADSSEIEKEADQIITLFRPAVHDENADPAEAILSVEKNRHGPTGIVKAAWLAQTMRFENYAHG